MLSSARGALLLLSLYLCWRPIASAHSIGRDSLDCSVPWDCEIRWEDATRYASPAGFSIAEWNGLDRVDIAPDSFATIGDVKFIEYGDCKLHWGGVLALAPGNRRERLQPRARSLVATTATGRTRARWPFTRSATRSDLRTLGPEVQPLLEGSIDHVRLRTLHPNVHLPPSRHR